MLEMGSLVGSSLNEHESSLPAPTESTIVRPHHEDVLEQTIDVALFVCQYITADSDLGLKPGVVKLSGAQHRGVLVDQTEPKLC